MKKYSLLFAGIVAMMVIHRYFALQHLYGRIWWLDIVLHIIGAFFLVVLYRSFFSKRSFLGLCVFLISAGLAWEVFEFFFNGSLFGMKDARLDNPLWVLDTIKDMLVDVTAGILWWHVSLSYNKHNV